MTPEAIFGQRHQRVHTSVVTPTPTPSEPPAVTCLTAMAMPVSTAPLPLNCQQVVGSCTTTNAAGTGPSVQTGPVLTVPTTGVTLPALLHRSRERSFCRLRMCTGTQPAVDDRFLTSPAGALQRGLPDSHSSRAARRDLPHSHGGDGPEAAHLPLHREKVVGSFTTPDAVGTGPSVQTGYVLTTLTTAVTLTPLLHSSLRGLCLCTSTGRIRRHAYHGETLHSPTPL